MKLKMSFFRFVLLMWGFNSLLESGEYCNQNPPQGWVDRRDVHLSGDDLYIDTNGGMIKLTVIQYDPTPGDLSEDEDPSLSHVP